jgi:hypothetical protein
VAADLVAVETELEGQFIWNADDGASRNARLEESFLCFIAKSNYSKVRVFLQAEIKLSVPNEKSLNRSQMSTLTTHQPFSIPRPMS